MDGLYTVLSHHQDVLEFETPYIIKEDYGLSSILFV